MDVVPATAGCDSRLVISSSMFFPVSGRWGKRRQLRALRCVRWCIANFHQKARRKREQGCPLCGLYLGGVSILAVDAWLSSFAEQPSILGIGLPRLICHFVVFPDACMADRDSGENLAILKMASSLLLISRDKRTSYRPPHPLCRGLQSASDIRYVPACAMSGHLAGLSTSFGGVLLSSKHAVILRIGVSVTLLSGLAEDKRCLG